MGFFEQVADAKATVQSSYFGPGTYVVEITGWKTGQTRNKRPFVVLETEVLASDDHERHPVKSAASWMQMLDMDMTWPNVKAAILGLLQLNASDPEQLAMVTADVVRKCVTCDDPAEEAARVARLNEVFGDNGQKDRWKVSQLLGVKADVLATPITTRAGKPFTRVAFKGRAPDADMPVLAHRQRAKEEIAAAAGTDDEATL